MKTILYMLTPFFIGCVLFVILITPARAQSVDSQITIQLLLKQLSALQEQLRVLLTQKQSAGTGSTQYQYQGTDSWEKRFVSNPSQIPTNAFRAFYFDARNPGVTVYQEIVTGADTHYLPENTRLAGIGEDNFGGYWIGNYVFLKEQVYTFHVSQGSSESRIRVNGVVVFEGNDSRSFNYTFKPGSYKIEIEQFNKRWQSSGSTIFLLPFAKTYSTTELSAVLAPQWQSKGSQVWLASPYDLSGADRTIKFQLKPTTVPTTLVLSSYIATTWSYPINSQANIKAIVVSSYDKGSSIKNVPPNIPVYVLNDPIDPMDGNNLVTLCSITDDYCSRDYDFRPGVEAVAAFFGGKKPAGIGGFSAAGVMVVPVVTLDEAGYQKLEDAVSENEQKRSEYQNSNNLENIFRGY